MTNQMAAQLTEEEIRLKIGHAILKDPQLRVGGLLNEIFGTDNSNLTSVIRDFVVDEFLRQLKKLCRFVAKSYIGNNLKNGSSDFIKQFVTAEKSGQLLKSFPEELQHRLLVLQENDALGSLFIECNRLFIRLRQKYAPAQSEDKFRDFVAQWLQSGLVPLAIWNTFDQWKRNGPTLIKLKALQWPQGAQNDTNWREFQRLMKNIKSDNFIEVEKLQTLLNLLLVVPNMKVVGSAVTLIGRTIYLSEWKNKIEQSIQTNKATQAAIYAEDCLAIDCDLTSDIWQGKNLIIVSKVVYVWKKSTIRLSGKSYSPKKTKATSASSTAYYGADGNHGRAGESSGNIAVLATKMYISSNLTVELNGGRGEDGQDGGDGCDGKDGVGVTQSDLDQLVVKYYSLYRDSWDTFQNYSPPSNWTIQTASSASGNYIHRTYKDENGRSMTFSYAADKGWTYTTYELYFLISGSNGTNGTSGGKNGVGGQGGYNGTSTIQNPETGQPFEINIVRNGKSSGQNGNNGTLGTSGKHGVNGNDMALIDRSAQEASKHYEGSTDRKLTCSYIYKAECKSRLNGYRRYEEKENACFIKFGFAEEIDRSERRANKAEERTTRTSASEAVAKQSIVISSVLSETETMFGKQNAFLADTCKATAETAVNQDEEEEEEEAAENVTEETVVLRQKDEVNKLAKYTPESEKKQRPVHTPDTFVAHVKAVGRYTTINTCAQILFDLFTIEFPPPKLDSISLLTLFQQIEYRRKMQSSFSLVLLASLQSKIVNGKSYDEIKHFTATLFNRRKRKFESSRLRQKLQSITLEADSVAVSTAASIKPGDDHIFGITENPLASKLIPYAGAEKVKEVVKSFYSRYILNEVSQTMLAMLNDYLKSIKPIYHPLLALFDRKENFKWTNKEDVTNYLDSMKAWFVEESLRQETIKKHKTDKDDTSTTGEHEQPSDILIRDKTKLETDFEHFLKAVVADSKYWSQIIKQINELISKDSEYKARFGAPPSFDEGGFLDAAISKVKKSRTVDEKSIERAQHIIKIYYLAKSILNYNQVLYTCNALMLKDQGKFPENIRCDNAGDFDDFLSQLSRNPVPSESNQCEVYMTERGLACGPFRYLLSLHLNIKLCSYRKVSYQTLQKIETFNPTAPECEILWLKDDGQPVGIAADKDFRTLITAQKTILKKYENDLSEEMRRLLKMDYTEKENRTTFASFFPKPLRSAAIEWIENYMAITQDQIFLHLLYNRFWVDGCQLSIFELQFLLASCANLTMLYHCDLNYLLLLANSVSQSQLIDVFLYLRVEYHLGRRLPPSSKIFTAIQLIPNTRFKALLAVKLSNYHLTVSEEDFYKLILMLQHTSNGSEQLTNIDLDEWISIAQKQKWSEIGYLLKQYGSIGYYLGFLDNKGFHDEEQKMRAIIDEAKIIPEKLIALYTQWIVSREIVLDESFFPRLREFFIQANHYPELKDTGEKYQLLTTEVEQAKLINWMNTRKISENHVNYDQFASAKDRTVDELAEKITGLYDSPEFAVERRKSIKTIADRLKANDSNNSPSINWLNKFDEVLFRLKNKRLRPTQKMAILCAVESPKHVLEQVNTGEGKSLIIAAIAIILCKTGQRYVDVITSSPVLAQRDADEMTEIYNALDLTVANNYSEALEDRKKAYTKDIVYGDMARFQRDYLLHTFYKKPLKGDRTQVAVIVDEVDNMLLDNGNNMLYLSHNVPGLDLLDSLFIFIQQQIYNPIYTGEKTGIEQMQKQFDNGTISKKVLADIFGQFSIDDLKTITERSSIQVDTNVMFDKLIQKNIIDAVGYLQICRHDQLDLIKEALQHSDGALVRQIQACFAVIMSRERNIGLPLYLRDFVKLHLDEFIENCKSALFLEPKTGYVVDCDHTGKSTSSLESLVTIIDSNTGADLATSQWCGGLHQFLQLKHGCRLSPLSLKAVFVSNVAYLKGYKRINGLSGTLGSTEESKTLIELYGADLIKIPTNRRKVFYENVPVVATVEEDWIQNIYDEICDQVTGTRSVLLICEDIKQLEKIVDGLNKCLRMHKNPSGRIQECFKNKTLYKREHDEFNFEDKTKFESHQLIIATNLAGRGTDIKLSQSLVNAGGLHVITAFLPKNCRIEEQAFGRTARCGQPGSAQIIAFAEPGESTVQPSVFQLKMFRDNAEVHRLQSLKSFYDYHTDIEESCLEKFRNYCDKALSAIYSTGGAPDDESLPTASQVVYFALLDQWAFWLDAKAPLVKQCAMERSAHSKANLINSVTDFLNAHPFGDQLSCFEVAKTWINAPQSLLTIGILQMHHQDGFREAENTFNNVLMNGNEFGAEAFYYKACMRMKNFHGARRSLKTLTLSNTAPFKEDIPEAIELFYKSRTLFLHRLQQKQKEASIVARMVEKSPTNNPKVSGFVSQQKSICTYIQLIMMNIDYLLGAPCQSTMFKANEIDETYSKQIFDAFDQQGLISPTLLTGRPLEDWQIEPLRRKYKLHKKQIETLIERMSKDPSSLLFEDHSVLQRPLILENCPLSSKSEFWTELEQQNALYDTDFYLLIQDQSALSNEALQIFDILKPYLLTKPEQARTLLQYSNMVDISAMYKFSEVQDLMAKNKKFNDEVNELIEKEKVKLDKIANILIIPKDISYFSTFDGVTADDLKQYFNLTDQGAGWILNYLRENGILQLQTVKMTKLTSNNETWTSLVRSHLKDGAPQPKETDPLELKLLYNNAGTLQQVKDNTKLLNVTEEVIQFYCQVPPNTDKQEALKKFYAYLNEKNILEPYLYSIWRLDSKLDCSSLPRCIADQIEAFLSDRFAYTFALEDLCFSLEAATKDPQPALHRLFLPENPFAEVFDDFVNCGLAMPPRLCTSVDDLGDFDYEDFKHEETIKSIVHSNRLKLYDQTDYHMDLLPFATYVLDQGFPIDSDLRAIISNGLKVVVTKKKEKPGWWLLNKTISAAAWCWSGIKSAASAVISFGYSAVQFLAALPGKIFGAVSDFVAPYAKEVGKFIYTIARPLLESAVGKAAVNAMQSVANFAVEATYKTVDATEWLIGKGTQAVNYAGRKATEAVKWVNDTTIVKGGVNAIKDFGSWVASTTIWQTATAIATYVYTTMSNFCTAVVESYLYYNQCRTASRRIVLEKQGLIDEHSILITFHGISQQEAKKVNDEKGTDESIRAHIESWRLPLLKNLLSTLEERFKSLAHDKYTIDFVKSSLGNSSALKNLQVEINELLNFSGWLLQVEYFARIHDAVKNNKPLKTVTLASEIGLPYKYQFFFEDSIDEILEEFQKRIDDEGYESDTTTRSDASNDVLIEAIEYKNWKDIFTAVTKHVIQKSIDSTLIEPSISIILNYLSSLRDANMPPSEAQRNFNDEDKSVKQALIEYRASNQSKQKSQFLMNELNRIIHEVLTNSDANRSKAMLKIAIRYGYPLPISAAKTVVTAMDIFLTKSGIYQAGITLKIVDNTQRVIAQHKIRDGKGKLVMQHFNGSIFLCQNDYRAYVGLSNQATEQTGDAFFYEAFTGYLKHLRPKFPKQAETLRDGILSVL